MRPENEGDKEQEANSTDSRELKARAQQPGQGDELGEEVKLS